MTNRQKAALILAERIHHALAEPMTADELRSVSGESTDFTDSTVSKVAAYGTKFAQEAIDRLDRIADVSDRYPEPEIKAEHWR